MRKFKVKDFPDPALLALLDIPLNLDVSEEEFDKLADLKPGEAMQAGSYTVLRVD